MTGGRGLGGGGVLSLLLSASVVRFSVFRIRDFVHNNITNQDNENLILCAKVSENIIFHLILIPNFAEKMILHTNHLPNLTENLGSNVVRVAQLLYNIGMKLLSQM